MKQLLKYLLILFIFLPFVVKSQQEKDSVYESIQHLLYDNPDQAIAVAKKQIASETDIDKKIKYQLYLSKAYTAKRNSDESYKALLEAQKLLDETKNIQSKIDVLILIAIQYQQMELYNKSFEILDEADALCQKLEPQYDSQKYSWLGKSYAVKGIIYKSQGDNEIALDKFFNSIKNFEKAPNSVPTNNNISIVFYNIGSCYLNLKNFYSAEKYFHKSVEYAKKSNAQSLKAYALKGLGENYSSQNKPNEAIKMYEEASLLSKNIGDLVLDEGIYKGLSDNYLRLGDFQKYYQNNELFKKAQFDKEQNELKSINSLLENLNIENQESLKNIKKNHALIDIFFILATLFGSGFLFFKAYQKNKINTENRKKLQEILTK